MNDTKKTIICIIGESGTGKTALANHLQTYHKTPTLVSCTTRPMRPGETYGVEHIFLKDFPYKPEDCLAYTKFGDYDYWTMPSQLTEPVTTYVIDEDGLHNLKQRYGLSYGLTIITVRIHRELYLRKKEVGRERVERDKDRYTMHDQQFDLVVNNNGNDLWTFLSSTAKKIMATLKHYEV